MEDELKICPKCGWYEHGSLERQCDPSLGLAAAALQGAVPEIRSTKLGYGHNRITFEISDGRFCVGLDVRHTWTKDGERDLSSVAYDWRYLHALGGLSHDDAVDLARTLRDWNDRCQARKDAA